MKNRCPWAENEISKNYHDEFWGKPCRDDNKLFKMLVLETFQSGLSWNTILQKEEAFDAAFDNFDAEKIAKYSEEKVEELMKNTSIVRHEKKIRSTIENARAFLLVKEKYGSFANFIWRYTFDTPIINPWSSKEEVPSKNPLSDKICEDMKKEGFCFIGSTTIHSFLQACGVINDHLISCDFKYED